MLLIDALHIHESGGKSLLDYLMEVLGNKPMPVLWLLDNRLSGDTIKAVPHQQVIYEKASLLQRKAFYEKNGQRFTTVFCLANIPPPVRLPAKVYTLFHLSYYTDIPSPVSMKSRLSVHLKRSVLKRYSKNCDFWIAQTNWIAARFSQKFDIPDTKILTLPFFRDFRQDNTVERIKNTYIFVSIGVVHKNHERLINAFCLFYDRHKKGILQLTLPEKNPALLRFIEQKAAQGYPIENIGIVSPSALQKIYSQTEYHIFPSLSETLGLGIIESIQCGCKVIGADLPYMDAACIPSLKFDPYDTESIANALSLSLGENIPPSVCKIENKMSELSPLLTD
ncbi:MAG: hypothetical protein QM727_08255 [Niabella sp.]